MLPNSYRDSLCHRTPGQHRHILFPYGPVGRIGVARGDGSRVGVGMNVGDGPGVNVTAGIGWPGVHPGIGTGVPDK